MSDRSFHPSELGDVADPLESADLLRVARELERLDGGAIRPSDGFTDRVLIAIANEPLPRPMAVAGLAARQGRVWAMLAALRDTWHVAWSGGRPLAIRAQAMAFVLLLVVAVGSVGAVSTVGALNLLFPPISPPSLQPAPTVPLVTSPPTEPSEDRTPSPEATPSPSAEPTETPEPTKTAEPTDTPEPTDNPSHTERPGHTETPEPTDTHETDDSGDSHGGGGDHTPEPTDH